MLLSRRSVWRHTWGFGVMVGGLLILASLTFYLKDQPVSINHQLTSVNYFLVMTGIFFSVKRYRDTVLGGVISYRRAVGAGVATLFIASLAFAIYTYIMMAHVDHTLLDQFVIVVRDNFVKQGMDNDTLEQMMILYNGITPELFSYTEVLSKTFMGLFFSLIMGGFIRRNRNLLNAQSIDKFDQIKRT